MIAHDRAPSSLAKCYICGSKCVKGDFRFNYCIKQSSSLRDRRQVHPWCVKSLPLATRAVDREYLGTALSKSTSVEEQAMLENLYDELTLTGGGAASSAAAK